MNFPNNQMANGTKPFHISIIFVLFDTKVDPKPLKTLKRSSKMEQLGIHPEAELVQNRL